MQIQFSFYISTYMFLNRYFVYRYLFFVISTELAENFVQNIANARIQAETLQSW